MPALPAADPQLITDLLDANSMWGPIEVVGETTSTNTDLMTRARAGAAEGTVLIAEHQAGGKGRFARSWEDVPGANVAMSVLVRPTTRTERWGWLSLLAGMAVAQGVRDVSGATTRVGLKWPNDVLVDGAKICGILSETDGRAAVIGMGVNVGLDTAELPVAAATSMNLAGFPTDKNALIAALLNNLQRYYWHWQEVGDVRAEYERVSATIGKRVRVLLEGTNAVEGMATGIDHEGSLLVTTASGTQAFAAGDVVHLRAGAKL